MCQPRFWRPPTPPIADPLPAHFRRVGKVRADAEPGRVESGAQRPDAAARFVESVKSVQQVGLLSGPAVDVETDPQPPASIVLEPAGGGEDSLRTLRPDASDRFQPGTARRDDGADGSNPGGCDGAVADLALRETPQLPERCRRELRWDGAFALGPIGGPGIIDTGAGMSSRAAMSTRIRLRCLITRDEGSDDASAVGGAPFAGNSELTGCSDNSDSPWNVRPKSSPPRTGSTARSPARLASLLDHVVQSLSNEPIRVGHAHAREERVVAHFNHKLGDELVYE